MCAAGRCVGCCARRTTRSQNRRDQERRSQPEQRDIQALVQPWTRSPHRQAACARRHRAATGRANHFVRGGDGDLHPVHRQRRLRPSWRHAGVALYIRVVNEGQLPPARRGSQHRSRTTGTEAAAGGRLSVGQRQFPRGAGRRQDLARDRAQAGRVRTVHRGEGASRRSSLRGMRRRPRQACCAMTLTVPDFNGPDISTSSVHRRRASVSR